MTVLEYSLYLQLWHTVYCASYCSQVTIVFLSFHFIIFVILYILLTVSFSEYFSPANDQLWCVVVLVFVMRLHFSLRFWRWIASIFTYYFQVITNNKYLSHVYEWWSKWDVIQTIMIDSFFWPFYVCMKGFRIIFVLGSVYMYIISCGKIFNWFF